MDKTFVYKPLNVCSREIQVTYDEESHIIKKVVFVGGCSGNTQGVSRLAVGRTLEDVSSTLEGIKCPGSRTRQTSCPDQLALAIKGELGK